MKHSASALRKQIDVLEASLERGGGPTVYQELLKVSAAFDHAPVVDAADADAKLRDAVGCLAGIDLDGAARKVRALQRSVQKIDGAWLRDLRAVRSAICDDPYADYAIRCIDSVIAGMSRPRLVKN